MAGGAVHRALESATERLMISPNCELTALQPVAEMLDSQIDPKKLAIKGTVFHLSGGKLLREERERWSVNMSKDGADRDE